MPKGSLKMERGRKMPFFKWIKLWGVNDLIKEKNEPHCHMLQSNEKWVYPVRFSTFKIAS